ncbi:MAG: 8-amino-7-oxononanoate synthase [Candidatus Gastranaerophilales bacterium]|nr:8-amino-7-oxononanoate synthase [Candidatus Gastranaerophilales bacterium]
MSYFEQELDKLKETDTYRQIPQILEKEGEYVVMDNSKLLNLSSNDYLGLSTNEELVKEFINSFEKDDYKIQFSSASARLLSGSTAVYGELEKVLAGLFCKESALIFNTGYQCNLGVVSTIARKGDIIFSDKLNHASIIDGMKLSEADFHRYRHLDYEHLEELLIKYRSKYQKALIISESLFSMDGDIANIRKLVELKQKYNAILMIDEAHAFCSIDDNCAGLSDGLDVDIVTATFGKSLGSFGAFVVSNKTIINYLINKARSFIFSTSIPPINIAWTKWLLTEKQDFIQQQKMKLARLVIGTHKYLKSSNIDTVSESQIIPLVFGDDKKTVEVAEQLKSMGYFILPIRPPTVPPNTSRLRLSLTANIDFENIKSLIDYIKDEL